MSENRAMSLPDFSKLLACGAWQPSGLSAESAQGGTCHSCTKKRGRIGAHLPLRVPPGLFVLGGRRLEPVALLFLCCRVLPQRLHLRHTRRLLRLRLPGQHPLQRGDRVADLGGVAGAVSHHEEVVD